MDISLLSLVLLSFGMGVYTVKKTAVGGKSRLPRPKTDIPLSIERALHERRSVRDFKRNEPLTLEDVAQLFWAAQGVTHEDGLRTAPSAGALYPLGLHIVVRNVKGLSAGVYHYSPQVHSLTRVAEGDIKQQISAAAHRQDFPEDAPATIVITAEYGRTTKKYLERGRPYVHCEAGHASQNIYLQCSSLTLGTVVVGAFDDAAVRRHVNTNESEEPLYLMPVGKK